MFTWYYLVIFIMAAIIPSLVVAVIAMLRIEALRGDIVSIKHHTDTACQGVADIRTYMTNISASSETMHLKLSELQADNHGTRTMVKNLEESIVSLSNKWNSRERAEKQAVKRKQKEEVEDFEEYEANEIPGTEQQLLPLDFQRQPIAHPAQVQQRRFGEPIQPVY